MVAIGMLPAHEAESSVHDGGVHCHEKYPCDEAHDCGSDEMSRLCLEDFHCVSGEKENTSRTRRLLHGPVALSPYQGSLTPMLKLPKMPASGNYDSHPTRQAPGSWMVTISCGRAAAFHEIQGPGITLAIASSFRRACVELALCTFLLLHSSVRSGSRQVFRTSAFLSFLFSLQPPIHDNSLFGQS